MSESIRALISELKAGLVRLYGDRLKGLYLYGSYARGDQDRESDIDILIVLDRLDQYGKEVDRTSRLVSDLSLEYGLSISRVFVTEGDWLEHQTPFLVNAREEAIPA